MHRLNTIYKRRQSKTVLNKYILISNVWEKQGINFFTGGSIFMEYGLMFWSEVMEIIN